MPDHESHRVLVVDDDPLVSKSLVRLLRGGSRLYERSASGSYLTTSTTPPRLLVDSAAQGKEALALVRAAVDARQPYAVAFVDIRMPPGWDGVETIEHLWAVDPKLQVVICTAHSDYAWGDIVDRLGASDGLLVLKKPFDAVEALQMVHALTRKWTLNERATLKLHELERMTAERTCELAETLGRLKAEVKTRERISAELQQAHKLEAMGQLASGIAHEVNTPAQFVGDNLHFLHQAFDDLLGLVDSYRGFIDHADCASCRELAGELRDCERRVDFDFLRKHVPRALEAGHHGVDRISAIVSAMRKLVHPTQEAMEWADLNQTVLDALALASTGFKQVTTVETDLGDLPLVECRSSDVGTALLNLIVNATHAIEEAGRDGQGRIHVSSWREQDEVVVAVKDNGIGISPASQPRVFEPFFTTKGVGRGTGQGLALAHAVVVTQHGGALTFDSRSGEGTTFFLRLPIGARGASVPGDTPLCAEVPRSP
jgi:two-component system, NtrC family, sensor kinase